MVILRKQKEVATTENERGGKEAGLPGAAVVYSPNAFACFGGPWCALLNSPLLWLLWAHLLLVSLYPFFAKCSSPNLATLGGSRCVCPNGHLLLLLAFQGCLFICM